LRLRWLRHGLLNAFEQGFTRASDAIFSLALVAIFPPEQFSRLALAQAAVAPLLLLFIAPEAVMYKDFGLWHERGIGFTAASIRGFRIIGWWKAAVAVFISAAVAAFGDDFSQRFFPMIWAFCLVLMPQIAGADREYLRLSLNLRQLNLLTAVQKSMMLGGLMMVVFAFQSSIPALACFTALIAAINAILAKICVDRTLLASGATRSDMAGEGGPGVREVLYHSLRSYSFWNHISGNVLSWVQTMDLFFLGTFSLPAHQVGLYAFALKISNMALMLPTAIANSFQIWLGRRISTPQGDLLEWRQQKRFSIILAGIVGLACLAIAVLAPAIFTALARGRWSAEEQTTMSAWMYWILGGAFLYSSALPTAFWLQVRVSTFELFKKIYLPWLICSLLAYGYGTWSNGFEGAAMANVAVGAVFVCLVGLFVKTSLFKGSKK
jgi:hypothetical protein